MPKVTIYIRQPQKNRRRIIVGEQKNAYHAMVAVFHDDVEKLAKTEGIIKVHETYEIGSEVYDAAESLAIDMCEPKNYQWEHGKISGWNVVVKD